MKAKVRTNIDPWNDKVYTELEVGKEYEVVEDSFKNDLYDISYAR